MLNLSGTPPFGTASPKANRTQVVGRNSSFAAYITIYLIFAALLLLASLSFMPPGVPDNLSSPGGIVGIAALIALVVGALLIFILPFTIARESGHPSKTGVCFVNLLLGWTVIGWIAAMIWALSGLDGRLSALHAGQDTHNSPKLWKILGVGTVIGISIFFVGSLYRDNGTRSTHTESLPTSDNPPPALTSKLIAVSHTAEAITGDIEISTDNTLTICNHKYPSTLVRVLQGRELDDAAKMFSMEAPLTDNSALRALYRVNIPADDKQLNGNTICGTDDAKWVVALNDSENPEVWNIAFFSGDTQPDLESQEKLCVTFTYRLVVR